MSFEQFFAFYYILTFFIGLGQCSASDKSWSGHPFYGPLYCVFGFITVPISIGQKMPV